MEVFQTSLSGIPLFRIVGDIDHYCAPGLEAAARETLASHSGYLLFDLSAVRYVDSGGAGVFLTLDRDICPSGWLGVIGANANLLRVFEIVGLASRPSFRIFGGPDDASAAIGDAPT
jgi:anti-sigma B factor antagonist